MKLTNTFVALLLTIGFLLAPISNAATSKKPTYHYTYTKSDVYTYQGKEYYDITFNYGPKIFLIPKDAYVYESSGDLEVKPYPNHPASPCRLGEISSKIDFFNDEKFKQNGHYVLITNSTGGYTLDGYPAVYENTNTEDVLFGSKTNVTISGKIDWDKSFELLELANKERAKRGLFQYYMNEDAVKTAMIRAVEVTLNFSHTTRWGSSISSYYPYNLAAELGSISGENILMMADSSETALEIHTRWMNSPGHRDNILSNFYSGTPGVGFVVFETSDGGGSAVQIFWEDEAHLRKEMAKKTGKTAWSYTLDLLDKHIETGRYYFEMHEPETQAIKTLYVEESKKHTVTSDNLCIVGASFGESNFEDKDTYRGYCLSPSLFQWSSSNSCVTISNNGVIKGKKAGVTTITAKYKNYKGNSKYGSCSTKAVVVGKSVIKSIKKKGKKVTIKWKKDKNVTGLYVQEKKNGKWKNVKKVKSSKSSVSFKAKKGTHTYRICKYKSGIRKFTPSKVKKIKIK